MTSREFYLERRKAELPVFLSVLRAIPADKIDYTPHERSPNAGQIVWTLTNELLSCIEAATTHRAQWHGEPPPSFDEMLALFEERSTMLIDAVSAMTDDAWDRSAQFYYGGKMVSEQPVSQFLWYIMFDAIHHRGQLTAYLRPMGGKVPAVYGPSADTRQG
jgi:uncharacterized damage-inducible protein DinB